MSLWGWPVGLPVSLWHGICFHKVCTLHARICFRLVLKTELEVRMRFKTLLLLSAVMFFSCRSFWFRQLDLAPFDGLIWPHPEGM